MKIFLKSLSYKHLGVFGLACMAFFACKKDPLSIIGGNLQPDSEFITANFDDTSYCLNLVTFSAIPDSFVTNNQSVYSLGSYYHPDMGVITSNIITQLMQNSQMDTSVKSIYAIDSAFINLVYSSAYPDDEAYPYTNMRIRIGELETVSLIDSNYASKQYYNTMNEDFISGNILSDYDFVPNLRDSVPSESDTSSLVANLNLRIPINQAYAEKLMDASINYESINQFLTDVRGIYIEAVPETSPGQGQIVNFNFTSSACGIIVYYRKSEEDTASTWKFFNIVFTGSKTYNSISVDRSNANPNYAAQLQGDTAEGQTMLYMQSFGGSSINIQMPDIRDLKNIAGGKKIVINQASIVMNTDLEHDRFSPHSQLYLTYTKDTSMYTIRDYSATPGGTYNSTKKEYRFYVTHHLQNLLLKDDAENYTLTLTDPNNKTNPSCFKAFGPARANGDKRMRLEVLYSIIP